MIKRIFKKSAVIFAATILFTTIFCTSAGTAQTSGAGDDIIRVGLYYRGSSVNTAQSIFDVSAQAGVTAGFVNSEGKFTEIHTHKGASTLYIRKDAYYHESNSGLKEYTGSGSDISGRKYGPYHVKIGGDYPDAASAMNSISLYRQSGIEAYIAYNDAWQVWTGFCLDEAEAEQMTDDLKKLIPETVFEIIKASSDRVVVADGQHKTLCIFDSSRSFFQVRPAPGNEPAVINIKGKPYRGAVEVRRLSNSDMTVINVVSVREYLYGNVPPEIGGRSPAEALKAQAVVSKMYALNNKGKHGSSGFDICATTHCQVYKGYSVEIAECNKVIDEVSDKVLTYKGKPVEHVYYFASGGGSTEDVRNVWGSSYPYLVSVKDDYEKIYTWTKTLRASDVKAKLPELGNILGITITRTAPTGRVTQLAVTGTSRGEPLYFSNERCRTLFGLDSQLYTITTDADIYVAGLSDIPAGQDVDGADGREEIKAEKAPDTLEDAVSVPESADDAGKGKDTETDAGNEKPVTEATADESVPSDGKEIETKIPAFMAPTSTEPVKTQLGGKKVATASGVKTVSGVGNKVTIVGADGVVNKAAVVPETYTFTGKGWGHAVGMSQEGAIGMAKAGMTYEDILMHYFQGTKVE